MQQSKQVVCFAQVVHLQAPGSEAVQKIPVISPNSEEASKMEGVSNMKVAVPFVPSLLRVILTSGTDGSLTPRMN